MPGTSPGMTEWGRRRASIPKPHIAHELAVLAAVAAHGIRGKAVVGIAHRDAGHDHLAFRNLRDLAHDVGAHDALAVDDAAEPAVPCGEHDAITERAEIEMHDRAGIE